MKKFLEIYLGFFIALPLALCIVLYAIGCFMTWSILEPNIEWTIEWAYVRLYMVIALIVSIFLAADE
jgi:hypothetical protein